MQSESHRQTWLAKGSTDHTMTLKPLKHEDLSSESHFALTTADSLKHSLSSNREALRVSPFITVASPEASADPHDLHNTTKNISNNSEDKLFFQSPEQQPYSEIDYFFDNFENLIKVTYNPQHNHDQLHGQQDNHLKEDSEASGKYNPSRQPVVRALLPFFEKIAREEQANYSQKPSVSSKSNRYSCTPNEMLGSERPQLESTRTRSQSQSQQQPQSVPSYLYPKPISFPISQQPHQVQSPQIPSSQVSRNIDIQEGSFAQPQPSNTQEDPLQKSKNFLPHKSIVSQQYTQAYQILSQQSVSSLNRPQQTSNYSPFSVISAPQQQQSQNPSNLPPNDASSFQPYSSLLPPPGPSARNNQNIKLKEQTGIISQNAPPPLPQSTRVQLNGYNTNHFNPQRFKYRHSLRDKENFNDSQNISTYLCENNPSSFQPNSTTSSNINSHSHSSFSKTNNPSSNISSKPIQSSLQAVQSSIISKALKNTSGQFFHTPSTRPNISINLLDQQSNSYNNHNNLRYQVTQKPTNQHSSSMRQHSVSSHDGSCDESSNIHCISQAQYTSQQMRASPQLVQFSTEELTKMNHQNPTRLRTESTYLPDRSGYQQSVQQQQQQQPIMGRMRAVSTTVSEQATRVISNRTIDFKYHSNNNNSNPQQSSVSQSQVSHPLQLNNYLANGSISYVSSNNNSNNLGSSSQNIPKNTSSTPWTVASQQNSLQASMKRDSQITRVSKNSAQANLINTLLGRQQSGLGNSFSTSGRVPQAPRASSNSFRQQFQ